MSKRQMDLSLDALGCVKAARLWMDGRNRELLQAWLAKGRTPADLVMVTLCLAGWLTLGTTDDEMDAIVLDLLAEGFPGEDEAAGPLFPRSDGRPDIP